MSKYTFITGHNWKSNRLGGFHKFAEAACREGHEVVFFSFPRPYYSYFMHQELFNYKSIKELSKGITYEVAGQTLTNITFPTFKLPNGANKILSNKIMNVLERTSLHSFKHFAKKWFKDTEIFVFESCDGMLYLDSLRKLFPTAKMIYRPSDPMMFDGALSRYVENETKMVLGADLNILVNNDGLELYHRKIPDFDTKAKYVLLSNGVDIDSYTKTYDRPELLKKENTILYVGAWEVEWELLFKAAAETPNFNYIIVLPNFPSAEIQKRAEDTPNLFYVPGISPFQVPAWITNCSVVMVPYVTDFYKNRPLGITAKYYQAMAAHKPIVAYCDTPKLTEAGAVVTYTYDDFIAAVKEAVKEGKKDYTFNLADRDWNKICQQFLAHCSNA